jgi:hypothetical protein
VRTANRAFGLILATFLSLASPGSVASQEITLLPGEVLPKLENVEVGARVITETPGIFSYTYAISNPASNTGEIWLVEIDITKPSSGQDLSGEGIINGPGYAKNTSEWVLTHLGIPLIPVGLFSPPDWGSGLGTNGTAGWGSSDAPFRIHPGQSLTGFVLMSRGVPGIRSIIVHPKFKQTPVPDATATDVERIRTIEKAIAVTLKTVSPTAPPKEFVALDFLNYLITLVYDSRNLGWIKVDGVKQSLLAKLLTAKRKLEGKDTSEAQNLLNAFLNEVRAVSCPEFTCPGNKPLTSEAYALLFFNGQYLLARLRLP